MHKQNFLFGHEPLGCRPNIRAELKRVERDPLEKLLVAIERLKFTWKLRGRKTKDAMEVKFEQFIRHLQPNAGYMRLYREIVLEVWRKKQGDSQQIQNIVARKIEKQRENKTKLEEAFVYQKAIDSTTYQEMRTKLSEDLTLAEMECGMPKPKRLK